MKKTTVKRVLSLVMALMICSSFLVLPTYAADMSGSGVKVTLKGNTLEMFQQAFNERYERQNQRLLNDCFNMVFKASMWIPEWNLTAGRSAYNNGSISYMSMNDLNAACSALNKKQYGAFEQIVLSGAMVKRIDGTNDYGIAVCVNVFSALSGGLLGDGTGGDPNIKPLEIHVFWLCDPSNPGNILVGNESIESEDIPAGSEDEIASTSVNIKGTWFPDTYAMNSKTYRMVSREELHNRAVELRGSLSLRNGKYYIIDYMGENIYCGYDGLPYCAWPQSTSVTETIRETDVVIDSATKVEVEIEGGSDVNLDIEELIATLPDGSTVNAENVIYDDNSQTYYINTSTGNETEGEDGTIYNTYNYSYTYNIDYTSVTYIGQTVEYNKHYEAYYKLPDGRSSADLTAAELEQLNLAVDVLNYGRSADDVSLRSLYHFDGETTDDSYWNYCTDFTWNTGASLTYMDAGNFEGALYLDETAHDFTLTLPSNLSNGDFTLQFRYYQSATLAPQTDSYVKFGDQTLLQLNGKEFLDSSGTVLTATPIGTWNELALIRHSGTLYYYLNGVEIGSVANTVGFGNTIQFIFGSAQQTYKYFDELRVLNFALAESGASYTPAAVPHDTNLSLVLPTDSKPIADEYWNITSSKTNLFGFTPEEFIAGAGAMYNQGTPRVDGGAVFPNYYNTDFGVISTGVHGLLFSRTSDYSSLVTANGSNYMTAPVVFKIGYYNQANNWYGDVRRISYTNCLTNTSVSNNKTTTHLVDAEASYVFSLALADGQVYKFPFTFSATTIYGKTETFDWGSIVLQTHRLTPTTTTTQYHTFIHIVPNDSIDVVYMEMVAGTETDLSAELVSSVTEMTPEQLRTPTLAVRSDIDVTSYQIGGVRPSIPKKGMVWALVENGTITSLQIYNGRAWEECDGRIWTGSRWISYTSYDIVQQKDLADIVGATTSPDYEYIYTDSGFWDWWQRSWNSFTDRFFSSQGSQEESHKHAYTSEMLTEPTCTSAGQQRFSCVSCGDSYIEVVDPLGHDYQEVSSSENNYHAPPGLVCSGCAGTDITAAVSGALCSCTCNDCGNTWETEAEHEYGETVYRCSRCGLEYTETNDDRGLFRTIGEFFADTIRWIVSKLGSLVAALAALAKLFADFIDAVISFAGDHPAFFAAALALIPADLMTLIWFSIVSGIIMLVWKKFKG